MRKIFKYIEPLWLGQDSKISVRATLAIVFSINFIQNLSFAISKWSADRSLEGLSLTLGIEAGLVVGLLGLTTYQNLQMFSAATKTSVEVNNPNGEGLDMTLKQPASTTNIENIENVNTK